MRRGLLPQVIGHRGAPGYRPEHTLASYRLAIALGADAVEPDLVMTADGVAVLRHETEISDTTDVARHPEFADRRTVKELGGREVGGWFCEDFTLAELKTLRAVERLPERRPRNTRWDGRFEIATFDELLMLLAEESRRWDRTIGLHVELKSSSYLASIGLPLEDAVLASLRDHGLDRRDSGVVLQSFETTNLRWLRDRTDLPLVQLVEAVGRPGRPGRRAVTPRRTTTCAATTGCGRSRGTPTCWAWTGPGCWPGRRWSSRRTWPGCRCWPGRCATTTPAGRSRPTPRSGCCWTPASTGCSATTPTRRCWSATRGPPQQLSQELSRAVAAAPGPG